MSRLFLLFSLCVLCACSSTRRATGGDDGKLTISFVQVNDVYEIAPLSGGKEGGLARVASLKKQVLQRNPNTFLVMAGDFLSPSVYNSIPYQGKAIRGKQMVEAMNAAGFDLACFGNHEFDIREGELLSRLDESRFAWISSNAFHKKNNLPVPFTVNGRPLPEVFILNVKDADGTSAKVAIISATLPFNKAPYVDYKDVLSTAKRLYEQTRDSVDAVVALTHQSIGDDEKLAEALPGIPLIMGGHEHDERFEKEGNAIIAKAHANARSAYVIDLEINKNKKRSKAKAKLEYLNEAVPLDSATNAVVQNWTRIADENFSAAGFDKGRVIISEGEALDGRETTVRRGSTNLTKLIVKAMEAAAPQAQVAIVNAGSIRIDDFLPMPLTEYDIIRAMPFGGGLREVEMKGRLLAKVLDQGKKNEGIGGYLQYSEAVSFDDGAWKLNGQSLDADKTYRVVTNDFLLTGGEANLDYFKPGNPDITKVYDAVTTKGSPLSDVRLALIQYVLRKK